MEKWLSFMVIAMANILHLYFCGGKIQQKNQSTQSQTAHLSVEKEATIGK
jgi:hypothetical protein